MSSNSPTPTKKKPVAGLAATLKQLKEMKNANENGKKLAGKVGKGLKKKVRAKLTEPVTPAEVTPPAEPQPGIMDLITEIANVK